MAGVGERRVAYRVLVEKSEGKRPLERPRRKLEDNINWIFKTYDGVTRIRLIWLRIRTVGEFL